MIDHIIKSYDTELARLTSEIIGMGELAGRQLLAAVDVVERRDDRAARHIVDNDGTIDAMEHAISQDVVRLLALRAPMARDLRAVFAALRIAADIERIGDYAANVAKRAIALALAAPVAPALGLRRLADLAGAGLAEVLAAYRSMDAERAFKVWQDDARLDEAYTALFRELLTYMMEDPRAITPCTHLLFMAKNIERIGDHVTNIAENVWFVVHGAELAVPRDSRDTTADPDWPQLGRTPPVEGSQ
ncbi:phosphate signaling complex protein PhoU [Dokdonella sp.]|uniref:phosphate signaling complex protein PhoU n=1 Tax=Dokdonella sp. TaxID=2291710 RepID=UPI0025B7A9C0|nr:phosphate signaling complex protein PhoU [Dokdonella sp.]MBX3690075.1 phosphate signaling complex protein PhoU [Dokdonella sp.]